MQALAKRASKRSNKLSSHDFAEFNLVVHFMDNTKRYEQCYEDEARYYKWKEGENHRQVNILISKKAMVREFNLEEYKSGNMK